MKIFGAIVLMIMVEVFPSADVAATPPIEQVPPAADPVRASLPGIKGAILAATGYKASCVDVAASNMDLVVTLTNSALASGSAKTRESEASKIAGAVDEFIRGKQALNGIAALHIDYLTREPDGHTKAVHKIDFRKDPQGRFRHIS